MSLHTFSFRLVDVSSTTRRSVTVHAASTNEHRDYPNLTEVRLAPFPSALELKMEGRLGGQKVVIAEWGEDGS